MQVLTPWKQSTLRRTLSSFFFFFLTDLHDFKTPSFKFHSSSPHLLLSPPLPPMKTKAVPDLIKDTLIQPAAGPPGSTNHCIHLEPFLLL